MKPNPRVSLGGLHFNVDAQKVIMSASKLRHILSVKKNVHKRKWMDDTTDSWDAQYAQGSMDAYADAMDIMERLLDDIAAGHCDKDKDDA